MGRLKCIQRNDRYTPQNSSYVVHIGHRIPRLLHLPSLSANSEQANGAYMDIAPSFNEE
jgi:hypothetical protein